MLPETGRPGRRRIRVLILRIGITGVFLVALGIAVASFALFGCACGGVQTIANKDIEGMTVNPPDPGTKPPRFLIPSLGPQESQPRR